METRRKLYEQALKDFEDKGEHTALGFCNYFYWEYDIDVHFDNEFERKLPELYAQKPATNSNYWFRKLARKPRIKCLKKAIELCK